MFLLIFLLTFYMIYLHTIYLVANAEFVKIDIFFCKQEPDVFVPGLKNLMSVYLDSVFYDFANLMSVYLNSVF